MSDCFATEKFIEVPRNYDSYNLVVHLSEDSKDTQNVVAYFKFNYNSERTILSANERIVFKFAEMLNLPMTAIKFHTFEEMKGHVSYAVPGEAEIWDELEIKFEDRYGAHIRNRIRECFLDIEPFFAMAVFDCWIANADRHGRNFMGTLLPGDDKLSLYLIDHGHCLIGHTDKWNEMKKDESEAWYDASRYIREPKVVNHIQEYDQLLPYIEKIEAITDEQIDQVIDQIPREYLEEEEAQSIKHVLKKRRSKLKNMIYNWCVKEDKVRAISGF